jgi:hypothetical protein
LARRSRVENWGRNRGRSLQAGGHRRAAGGCAGLDGDAGFRRCAGLNGEASLSRLTCLNVHCRLAGLDGGRAASDLCTRRSSGGGEVPAGSGSGALGSHQVCSIARLDEARTGKSSELSLGLRLALASAICNAASGLGESLSEALKSALRDGAKVLRGNEAGDSSKGEQRELHGVVVDGEQWKC